MVKPGTFLVAIIVCLQLFYLKDLRRVSFYFLLDSLAFALLVNSGYFIKVGSVVLEYEEILMICFIATWLVSGGFGRINSNLLLRAMLFLAAIAFGQYFLVMEPLNTLVMPISGNWDSLYAGAFVLEPVKFSSKNSERLLCVVLFVLVMVALADFTNKNRERKELVRAIIMITTIQTALGFIDLALKQFLHRPALQTLCLNLFGSGASQFHGIAVRAGSYVLQAFMKEPSHFAMSFIPGLTVLVLSTSQSIMFLVLQISSVVILLLSGSLAGFMIVAYWFVLRFYRFIVTSRYGKLKSLLRVGVVLLVVTGLIRVLLDYIPLLNYYVSRAAGLLGVGPSLGSESVRFYSIQSSLKQFLERPIFGIGLGSTNAHGFLPSLLSNIGIAGFFTWIALLSCALHMCRKSLYVFLMWLGLGFFLGDIGWLYNMMGVSMFLAITLAENKDTKAGQQLS
ncbi:hypothetical protein [Mesotoga sp. B105.6.4]|uniref:hypothetical protein n=1 Tax=Mesotoga sp. B105.6.4 TaxID=1582224 RepID=UPI000CCC5C22|nr:hypothetical protein [Mesotoga sp. B105.6.4]PNS36987.1 hypothetical protein RJ60_11595 [Mesotoga sp. B105.6.4]